MHTNSVKLLIFTFLIMVSVSCGSPVTSQCSCHIVFNYCLIKHIEIHLNHINTYLISYCDRLRRAGGTGLPQNTVNM